MSEKFARTKLIFGEEAMDKIKNAKIALFGVGGVGGYVAEALVRSGVFNIDLFDNDVIAVSNINRQIIATEKTIGLYKVDVMKDRILEINSKANIAANKVFYMPDVANNYDMSNYSYIIDAIDTVTAKIELITRGISAKVPIISSMGMGNKLDATKIKVEDIYSTSSCPLARVMRRELRARGVERLKVVYSAEVPIKPSESQEQTVKRQVPGSNAFVPPAAGLIIAGEVIKDIGGLNL